MPTQETVPPHWLQRSEEALATAGQPPLWIVEAHVGVHDGALLAVVKGIQVVAGKTAEAGT